MDEQKHTPGPWQWYCGGNHKALVRGGHSRIIMQRDSDGEINWNDAALIAAAPDLLAALKGIMSNFQLRNIGHGGRMDAAVDAARAAIAKAEGA